MRLLPQPQLPSTLAVQPEPQNWLSYARKEISTATAGRVQTHSPNGLPLITLPLWRKQPLYAANPLSGTLARTSRPNNLMSKTTRS
jgi:hypothetical protein